MINYNTSICSSIVYENSTNINRSCDYITNDSVTVDIIRIGLCPGSTVYDQIYRCNQNLCNNPTIENSVQSKIWSYASSFNILTPSKIGSITKNNTHYLVILLI